MNIQRICMDERQEWTIRAGFLSRSGCIGYDVVVDGRDLLMTGFLDREDALEDFGADLDENEIAIVTPEGPVFSDKDALVTIVTGCRDIIPQFATPKETA